MIGVYSQRYLSSRTLCRQRGPIITSLRDRLLFLTIPGTSCQATINKSLRDGSALNHIQPRKLLGLATIVQSLSAKGLADSATTILSPGTKAGFTEQLVFMIIRDATCRPGNPRSVVKLTFYIIFVAVAVSLLFRQVEWPWVAFRQGNTAFRDGNYREAAEFYEQAAQKLDDAAISERLAICWLRLNRPDQAKETLARLLKPVPGRLPTVELLAGLYQRDQQPKKAIALFSVYLSRHGKLDAAGELQLARIYRQASLYDEAAPYYLLAAENFKQKAVAEVELADMRSWQGNYDEAIKLYREVLAGEPSKRQARLSLARVLSWAGHYQDSENEYRRLLSKQ